MNKSDARNNLETGAIISAAVAVVFVVIYIMCGWTPCGSFDIVDLGLDPGWCCENGGYVGNDSDNATEDEPEEDVCPPLGDKLRDDFSAELDLVQEICTTEADGTWYEDDYLVGCHFGHVYPLACAEWEDSTAYKAGRAECRRQGGEFKCTSEWFACFCPGDSPLWDYECGWAYDDGLECDGSCDEGYCKEIEGECYCYYVPEYTCYDTDPITMCKFGTCPLGQYCELSLDLSSCGCEEAPL